MFSSGNITRRRFDDRFCWIATSFYVLLRVRIRSKVSLLLTLPVSVMVVLLIFRTNLSTKTRYPQFESSDTDKDEDFMCLFTTFKPEERKIQVYENLLYNCMSLTSQSGKVRCILYDTTLSVVNWNDTVRKSTYKSPKLRPLVTQKLVDVAEMIGWDVVVLPRVSPYDGLPYFKDMYLETAKRFPKCTFSTFVNADIMFGDGLLPTLEAVEKVIGMFNRTVLLIGKRRDVDMDSLSARIFSPKEVNRIAVGNYRSHNLAQDFFFVYKNNFPWHVVPDIVVGRVAYDNFIVYKAYQTNVSVVDMTRSVVAVHQSTSKDGKERRTRTHADINNVIIGRFNFWAAKIDSTPYLTDVDNSSSLVNVYRRCGAQRCQRLTVVGASAA